MKVVLFAALLGVAVAGVQQRPPDESNIPENEKRVPPGWHCKRPDVRIAKGERAVHCTCEYSCEIDAQGNVTEHESSTCMTYCHVHDRKCTCWPEGDPQHPCVKQGHDALMDMNGVVVAVKRHEASR